MISLLLAACVGGAGEVSRENAPATPPGSNGGAVVESPTGAEERRVLGAVAPDHLEQLSRLVGRYASGEAAIYRGTFDARNEVAGGPGVIDGELVTASIGDEPEVIVDGQASRARALTVLGATHRVQLAQLPSNPARTHFTLVTDERTTYGVMAACDGCVPRLDPSQPKLAFSDAVGEGTLGDRSSTFRVRASGTLQRIEPSVLTFEDLVAAASPSDRHTMGEFTPSGDVQVRAARGAHDEVVDESCRRVTSYRLEWFVDPRAISRYGIRGMVIEQTTTTCCPGGQCGGQRS